MDLKQALALFKGKYHLTEEGNVVCLSEATRTLMEYANLLPPTPSDKEEDLRKQIAELQYEVNILRKNSFLNQSQPTPSCLGEDNVEKILLDTIKQANPESDGLIFIADKHWCKGSHPDNWTKIPLSALAKALTGKIPQNTQCLGEEDVIKLILDLEFTDFPYSKDRPKRIMYHEASKIAKALAQKISKPEGLHITCDFCHTKLTEPGALLFGIPNEKEIQYCSKKHICKGCFSRLEISKPQEKFPINKMQEGAPEQIAKCYSCACAVLSSYDFGKHCLTCDPCGAAKGYVEISKPQESICASCLKNCKATHPRYACTLFKPQEVSNVNPEIGFIGNINSKPICPSEQKQTFVEKLHDLQERLDKQFNSAKEFWEEFINTADKIADEHFSKLAGQKSEQITNSLCDTCRKGCKVRREGTINNCSKYKPVCKC